VAQLGARFHGMEEVIGSIPIRSTNQFNHLEVLPFPPYGFELRKQLIIKRYFLTIPG
jgi:hypothetical protein